MAPTARPPPATAEDAVSHVCSYLQDFFFFLMFYGYQKI